MRRKVIVKCHLSLVGGLNIVDLRLEIVFIRSVLLTYVKKIFIIKGIVFELVLSICC